MHSFSRFPGSNFLPHIRPTTRSRFHVTKIRANVYILFVMFDCSLAKQGYSIQTNTVWWVLAEGSSLPHTVYTEYSVAFPIPGPRVEPRRRALPLRGRDGDPERQAQPRQHDLDEDPGRLHGPRGAARQGRRGIPPLHAGTGILSQPPEEARSLLIKGGKEIIVDWVVKNMQHFKMIETEKISSSERRLWGKNSRPKPENGT